MATDDGDLVVTFNGEIYNYLELREELGSPVIASGRSSDTEVLLHGYREWGTELPSQLRGHVRVRDRRSTQAGAVRRARSVR